MRGPKVLPMLDHVSKQTVKSCKYSEYQGLCITVNIKACVAQDTWILVNMDPLRIFLVLYCILY